VGPLLPKKAIQPNLITNKWLMFDKGTNEFIAYVAMTLNRIFHLKILMEHKVVLSSITNDSTLWHLRHPN